MLKRFALFACVSVYLLLLAARPGSAQNMDEELTEQAIALRTLRSFPLQELPGSVPTWHVPSAKQRALEYQYSLQPALAWFQEQLGLKMPLDLEVLDHNCYEKMNTVSWPLPYALPAFNYVVFPDHRPKESPLDPAIEM
jgi:hypothetical protein